MTTLLDGLSARTLTTPRAEILVIERDDDDLATPAELTVAFVAEADAETADWQEIMQSLPAELRLVAIEARDAESLSDALSALSIATPNLVARSTGAAVALDHAAAHAAGSLLLESPETATDAVADLVGTPRILWVRGADDTETPTAARDSYARAGGDLSVRILDAGPVPHRDDPSRFRQTLLETIGYVGRAPRHAPPTDTIILRSAD